jgi:hypothetical protein
MTWAITSNKGTCNSAAGSTFNIFRLSSQAPTDQEVLVRVNPADTSDIGCVVRYGSTTQFYYGVLTGGNTLAIGMDNSGFSTLASASFSYSAGTAYWLRFQVIGTTLKLRGWADGGSEPGTWNVTKTDSTFASGGFGLASDSGSATNTQFDSLTITDGATTGTTNVPSESVTLAETVTLNGSASLTDVVTLAESITQVGAASITDSVSLLESLTSTGAISTSESVQVAESLTLVGLLSLSEVVSLAESITQTGTLSTTDSAQLGETITFATLTILTLPTESVTLSEMVTLAGLLSLSDVAQLLESLTGTGAITFPVESVILIESIALTGSTPSIIPPIYIYWTTDDMSVSWTTDDMNVSWTTGD